MNRVERFNRATGNFPSPDDMENQKYEKLKASAERLLEEAQELYDAIIEKDVSETLKEAIDVDYVFTNIKSCLKAYEYEYDDAFEAVCDNNDLKWTTSLELAGTTWYDYTKKVGGLYMNSEYDIELGEVTFCIKRFSDDKVMKPEGHPKVDLTPYLPK